MRCYSTLVSASFIEEDPRIDLVTEALPVPTVADAAYPGCLVALPEPV